LIGHGAQASAKVVTVTAFESRDAFRALAGPTFEVAVVPPKRSRLPRFDARSLELVVELESGSGGTGTILSPGPVASRVPAS